MQQNGETDVGGVVVAIWERSKIAWNNRLSGAQDLVWKRKKKLKKKARERKQYLLENSHDYVKRIN